MAKLPLKDKINKIIIKKYSNRRLYDVTHSQYLTLDELVDLIKGGYDVQVVDSKTKNDITQMVLTQIFIDQSGPYLFSASFLHQVIRNREGILGEFFTDLVPKILDSYLEMRDAMKRQISTITYPITSPRNWLAATTKDLKLHLKKASQVPENETIVEKVIEPHFRGRLIEDSDAPPLYGGPEYDADEPPLYEATAEEDVILLKEKIRELETRINEMDR